MTQTGINIIFEWIPSHVGLSGNEMADIAAKNALSIETCLTKTPMYKEDIKCLSKNILRTMWQEHWDNNKKSRQLHAIQEKVNFKIAIPKNTREREVTLFKLRSGYIGTNSFKAKLGRSQSDLCDNCTVVDDLQHLLYNCQKYTQERTNLFDTLHSAGVTDFSFKNLFSGQSQTFIPIWKFLVATGKCR